ncbi:MAG: hypothetical protein PHO12_09650 [Bacteroidales bacterium]|nr:hypothetical protein [Bacteroidales bacterium]
MRKNITKYILFILMVAIMFLPLVQRLFSIFKEKELMGYFEKTPKPDFNKDNWFEVKYQTEIEKYTKENVGFRKFFVRSHNQINYSCFNTTNAGGIYVGKNKYLYEDGYIKNHLGLNFQGEDTIINVVNHLSLVRDSLKALGMDVVVVIAPGKGSFYPEFYPRQFANINPTTTNFQIYDRELRKNNINYINLNSWMLSLKGKSKYRLFPSTGVHWGEYAAFLAIDSITNYFENLYSINLPRIKIKSIKVTDKMYFKDDDAEKLMNLLFNIPDQPMPRIETTIVDSANADKLKVLILGDSYYYSLSVLGFDRYVFHESEFWYYFNEVHRFDGKDINDTYKGVVRDYDDVKVEMMKYKTIMIVITEGTLHFTPQLIFDELYSQFTNSFDVRQYKYLFDNYKNEILNNKEWYDVIVKKAKDRGTSIDQAINDNAEYMVKEYLKNNK